MGHKKPTTTELADQVEGQMSESDLLPENDPLEIFTMRLTRNDRQILKQHFRSMGINLGTGIRMILRKYIKEEI